MVGRMWWSAGAVVAGIGAALLAGSGVAAADASDSGGTGATSQQSDSAAADSSPSSAPAAGSASGTDTAATKQQLSRPTPGATIRDVVARPSAGADRARTADQAEDVDATTDSDAIAEPDAAAVRDAAPARPVTAGKRPPAPPRVVPRSVPSADPEPEKLADRPGRHDPGESKAEPAASTSPRVTASSVAEPTEPVETASSPGTAPDTSSSAPGERSKTTEPEAAGSVDTASRSVVAPAALASPVAVTPPGPLGQIATLVLTLLSTIGFQPPPILVTLFPALAPWYAVPPATTVGEPPDVEPSADGVTGVVVGHSALQIPTGYVAPADWYFPTQADGTVQAQGVIWLQHGFLANKGFYSALAANLAKQTNSVVVAPTLPSLPLLCWGCGLNDQGVHQGVASMFLGDRAALNASAAAAGFAGTLPDQFVLSGHSAGGGFATSVAGYTVDVGTSDKLRGVVMFDGVSMTGTLPQAVAKLDSLDDPIAVYQIGAPAQMWNVFGGTTAALIAARPGQFVGVDLAGGSHVDPMLGTDFLIDLTAQLVTRFSPPGNTAAVYTLATGWINDMYADAGPEDPQFGVYGQGGQSIVMGPATAIVLGEAPAPGDGAGTVTGIRVGSSVLQIPAGPSGYAAPADWYFPTQADGTVAAQGLIWLQHGYLGNKAVVAKLASTLAQRTNSIVVATTMSSDPGACGGDCWIRSVTMQKAVASLFVGDRAALNASATAAGFEGTLPTKFVLSGHSAGGGLAIAAAGYAVDNGAAANGLVGVVTFDAGSNTDTPVADSVAKLDTLGIPVYQIAAPVVPWLAGGITGETTDALIAARPDQFVGVILAGGSHMDASLGSRPVGDFLLQLLLGFSPPGNTEAVYTLATGWIKDMYAGAGPDNPQSGVYGQAGDHIIMGPATAIVLPEPEPEPAAAATVAAAVAA